MSKSKKDVAAERRARKAITVVVESHDEGGRVRLQPTSKRGVFRVHVAPGMHFGPDGRQYSVGGVGVTVEGTPEVLPQKLETALAVHAVA